MAKSKKKKSKKKKNKKTPELPAPAKCDDPQTQLARLRKRYPAKFVDDTLGMLVADSRTAWTLANMLGLPDATGIATGHAMINESVEALKPRDPIERMMIEQLVLCHERINKLCGLAATIEHVKFKLAANDQCDRAMSTFRRGMLALKQYRQTAPSKVIVQQVNQAEQQNVVLASKS